MISKESEVNEIIESLINKRTGIGDIPDEYSCDFDVIRTERSLGLRKNGRRGFDVLDNMFFVEQDLYFKISNVQFYSSKSKIK